MKNKSKYLVGVRFIRCKCMFLCGLVVFAAWLLWYEFWPFLTLNSTNGVTPEYIVYNPYSDSVVINKITNPSKVRIPIRAMNIGREKIMFILDANHRFLWDGAINKLWFGQLDIKITSESPGEIWEQEGG